MSNIFEDSEYGVYFDDIVTTIDEEWVSNIYMSPADALTPYYAAKRFHSFGDTIYGNTALGFARSINPKPQFGPYTDKPSSSRMHLVKSTENGKSVTSYVQEEVSIEGTGGVQMVGLGEYYAETFAKPEQILYLEAGVPKFTSLWNYFENLIDREELIAATKGGTIGGYTFGHKAGTLAMIYYFPVAFLVINGLKLLSSTFKSPSIGDYYYLKPAPHNYLSTFNTILTQFAIELGVASPKATETSGGEKMGIPMRLDEDSMKDFAKYFPQLITDGPGGMYFDVYKLITSSFRDLQARKDMNDKIRETVEAGGDSTEILQSFLYRNEVEVMDSKEHPKSLVTFYEVMLSSMYSNQNLDSVGDKSKKAPTSSEETKKNAVEKEKQYTLDTLKYASIAHASGSKYVPITVEYVGSSTYSFSNSVTDIGLEQTFNGKSRAIDTFKYSTFGGNILGDVATNVMDWATNAVTGAMDGASFELSNLIAGMLNGTSVSLPKKWSDSNVTFPTHTFEAVIMPTSGHPMALLTSAYTTISALLAFALPKAVGRNTYVTPYILSAFLRGVCNIKLGMMESLTIEYGVGNLGRNHMRPVKFKVRFTLVDMSEQPAAPTPAPSRGPIDINVDDSNPLSLVIRNMVGSSLYRESDTNSVWSGPQVNSRVSRALMEFRSKTSPAFVGSAIEEMTPLAKISVAERNLAQIDGDVFK